MKKTKKTTFKHMESEWANYHETKKEIAELKHTLAESIAAYYNDEKGRNQFREEIHLNKRLQHLEEVTENIEIVLTSLPREYKELVRLRYWNREKLSWVAIGSRIGICERQARRWRGYVMETTIKLMGWR